MISKNEAGLYEAQIDGHRYEFEKWGAELATDTLLDIAKIVGKPLGMAIGSFVGEIQGDEKPKSLLDMKVPADLISSVMDALMERFDKKLCMDLIKKLSTAKCICDGQPIRFDSHYQDRLDHLYRVVQAALEVQYGNFFSALIGLVGSVQRRPMVNRPPAT